MSGTALSGIAKSVFEDFGKRQMSARAERADMMAAGFRASAAKSLDKAERLREAARKDEMTASGLETESSILKSRLITSKALSDSMGKLGRFVDTFA